MKIRLFIVTLMLLMIPALTASADPYPDPAYYYVRTEYYSHTTHYTRQVVTDGQGYLCDYYEIFADVYEVWYMAHDASTGASLGWGYFDGTITKNEVAAKVGSGPCSMIATTPREIN